MQQNDRNRTAAVALCNEYMVACRLAGMIDAAGFDCTIAYELGSPLAVVEVPEVLASQRVVKPMRVGFKLMRPDDESPVALRVLQEGEDGLVYRDGWYDATPEGVRGVIRDMLIESLREAS